MAISVDLDLAFGAVRGRRAFDSAFTRQFGEMEKAATKAMDRISTDIKDQGRRDIAAGGKFGRAWQNAWRVDRYPKNQDSLSSAVYARHKIPYADVFEFGKTITGRPLLYVPTDLAPKKIGRFVTTPARFAQRVAPLFGFQNNGRYFLSADYRRGRGRRKKGSRKRNIIFVGVKLANHRKRFDLLGIVDRNADNVVSFYFEEITKEIGSNG